MLPISLKGDGEIDIVSLATVKAHKRNASTCQITRMRQKRVALPKNTRDMRYENLDQCRYSLIIDSALRWFCVKKTAALVY